MLIYQNTTTLNTKSWQTQQDFMVSFILFQKVKKKKNLNDSLFTAIQAYLTVIRQNYF